MWTSAAQWANIVEMSSTHELFRFFKNIFFRKKNPSKLLSFLCFYRVSSCVFVGTDLPRRGTLPVETQPDSADSLPDWLFWRLSAWRIIITRPPTTRRRVRRRRSVCAPGRLTTDWLTVCVCFIPVAPCSMDQTSFVSTCQIKIKFLSLVTSVVTYNDAEVLFLSDF